MGLRRGVGGSAWPAYLTWCQAVREAEPPLVIHENVCRFPKKQLENELGGIYNIYQLGPDGRITPESLGFPVRRQRCYALLVHKTKGNIDTDVLCAVSEALFVGVGELVAA